MTTNDSRLRKMARNASIVLFAFLLGLIPPLVRTLQLKGELQAARAALHLSQTRDLAALAYLEASRNNFGTAATHASALYDRLGEVAQTSQEPVRSIASNALSNRDAVMGMLATADPAARVQLEELTGRLLSADEQQTRARTK